MIRLNLVVEGQTEEVFIREILAPHLSRLGVFPVARCVLTGRKRDQRYKGGLVNYQKLKNDLVRWMKEDQNRDVRFSTMVDSYGLPKDFPGHAEAGKLVDPVERVHLLEARLSEDISDPRFIPHIQLHEFEALLFSDPSKFLLRFAEHPDKIGQLQAIRDLFPSPEHIDDGLETAPSKRITSVFPGYDKVSVGPLVAQAIGLDRIRRECRHFHDWVSRLEALAS